MKTHLLVIIIIICIFLPFSRAVLSQEDGFKNIRTYTREDHGAQAQNFAIAQDHRGVIYVGNQEGVLEYDGVSWREIEVPNFIASSLALGHDNRVYVGGKNELGFLAPGELGTLTYVSLKDHPVLKNKNFGNVRKIHPAKEGLYFQTHRYLFLLRGKEIKVWEPEGEKFNFSAFCKGVLYTRQHGVGLMELKGDSFRLVPGGEFFRDKIIFMLVPYDNWRQLIGTRASGFFLYDGLKANALESRASDYIKKNRLYYGIRLKSPWAGPGAPALFAAATQRGGLLVMDAEGNIIDIFNEAAGLGDSDVKSILEDNRGNLWTALNSGLSKVEYSSPFSFYDKRSNLPGLILTVSREEPGMPAQGNGNRLYAGTTRGLFFLEPRGQKFLQVEGSTGSCWNLLAVPGSLLAAAHGGVFEVRGAKAELLLREPALALQPSGRDSRRVWVVTYKGLVSLYRHQGGWRAEPVLVKGITGARSIVEDDDGTLWLGTATGNVLRVPPPGTDENNEPNIASYGPSHGLPEGWINVFKAANHIMFATVQGLYRIESSTGRIVPDKTLGEEFAGRPGSLGVFQLAEDNRKYIWFHSDARNIAAIPVHSNASLPGRSPGAPSYRLVEKPFLRLPQVQVNTIYPDPDGHTIWFGGQEGLTGYDKRKKSDPGAPFNTLLRRITVNGRTLFEGYSGMNQGGTAPRVKLSYRDRNIRFEFAAPFFENEVAINYRCLLEGYDTQWSDWATVPQKDYTNLDPGAYRFRVAARNIYETIGSEARFDFHVAAPWYMAWWVYLFYGLAALGLMVGVVRWRSGQLQREKEKLGTIVHKRTEEINRKNLTLEAQTRQLQEQSRTLQELSSAKSRFFANVSHEFRTPLTLIMGPLENMLAEEPQNKRRQKSLKLMLRNSQRLLGLINQLLELSRFDSGKVKLQASKQRLVPFLKGIATSFEQAAEKNELDLVFEPGTADPELYFDASKLEEVLFNLVSNAIKFTPPGGRVKIAVTQQESGEAEEGKTDAQAPCGSDCGDKGRVWVDISVSDTGPGISREQMASIFDRFFQADSTFEHHRKGSGIGLAIGKELTELHHGKLNVHSHEGECSGTEFIIRLPLGAEHLSEDEIAVEGAAGGRRRSASALAELYGEELHETEADQAGAGEEEEKADPLAVTENVVLVVEDSADVRQYITDSLEQTYKVVTAVNGEEGIKKAQELIPDLVISDLMMPKVDGYELCRQLKNDMATSHIPIILLTAKASEESVVQGLETGADDYITKPFNTNILLARIKNLIELRALRQQTQKREMESQPRKLTESKQDKRFIKKLRKVIDDNLSDTEFNTESMCKAMDMSQPTLYRKVHALTGESPTELLRSYRLKKAVELLKSNYGSVLEIALETGFSSANYFGKCFKQKYHQSPSTFLASESEGH